MILDKIKRKLDEICCPHIMAGHLDDRGAEVLDETPVVKATSIGQTTTTDEKIKMAVLQIKQQMANQLQDTGFTQDDVIAEQDFDDEYDDEDLVTQAELDGRFIEESPFADTADIDNTNSAAGSLNDQQADVLEPNTQTPDPDAGSKE
jgi:hypothetical protein